LAQQTPADLKKYLSSDQFKLYDLIWKRTIACQMIHATINTFLHFFAATMYVLNVQSGYGVRGFIFRFNHLFLEH
jgi:DNA topoisomerase-1